MSKSITLWVLSLSCCVPRVLLLAEDVSNKDLDRQYQLAVSNYDAGRYQEAAGQLEKLLPYATKSSTVHELLGMVYASLSEQDKAIEQLKVAVELKPDWAEARTNFGMALLQSGRAGLAEEQFKKAVALEPQNYNANHNLGEFYVESGKVAEALPLLERAHTINPGAYDNGYDLALAEFQLGHVDESHAVALGLAKTNNTGEVHNLLGHVEEKRGDFVAAANDFESATHLDPSEDNFFDWGCEMLLHRTYEPAITIFEEAARRYPKSPRILIGLGLSLYSRGKYDDAVSDLMNAVALNPNDPRGYTFLSEAYESSPAKAEAVVSVFKTYAELQPKNALAQYDYAMSLWKGYRQENATSDRGAVEALLLKAIALDDSLADAHEQLGNLYSDQREFAKSVPQYQRAVELNPDSADAHYRLGTDYVHLGQKDEAQKEFAVYQKLRAQHLDELEKQRAEVRQFVVSESAITRPKQ